MSGFTLAELLIGAAAFIITIGTAINLLLLLNSMWKTDLAVMELSRNANVAIEKMVDGAWGPNTGLAAARLGSAGTVPPFQDKPDVGNGSRVDYTITTHDDRSFYLSSGAIYRDGGSRIVADVESVNFSLINNTPGTVGIDLTLHKTILPRNKEVKFRIQTQVTPKN